MGRGKIQIKKIENATNRQVTFSKRRNGLFKKARELTVLCDAKVSIVLISSTGKLNEYRSENISTKEVFDRYQKITGKDLWITQYQKMQEELRQLKEKNSRLKREMRHKMGEDLSDLSFYEIIGLEQEMDASFKLIHETATKKMETRKSNREKKVKNLEKNCRTMLFRLGERYEDVYGFVKNEEVASAVLGNGEISSLNAYRLDQIQSFNLDHSGGMESFKLGLA